MRLFRRLASSKASCVTGGPKASTSLSAGVAAGRASITWRCGVEPDDLRDIRVVLQQVAGAQAEELLLVGLGAEVVGQLLQLFLVAAEVEAQVLFQPQHILDQAGAFLLEFVLVQQPEQGDDGGQQQHDAQLGQGEKPAQAPGADGRRKRLHGRMLTQQPAPIDPCRDGCQAIAGKPQYGYPQ